MIYVILIKGSQHKIGSHLKINKSVLSLLAKLLVEWIIACIVTW